MVASALSERLPFAFEYRGVEINPSAIALARQRLPGITLELGDLLALEPEAGWADLAVCLEVLEHLAQPRAAVERIRRWTARDALVSVPWEPYFRLGSLLRGKYVGTLGNHPEHLQHFTPRSLEALLRTHFDQVRVERCFPWLIAIAQTSSGGRRAVGAGGGGEG